MGVAAYTLLVDRQCDWLEELERILERFDAMSSIAQDAVGSVVESFLHDPDTTAAEIAHVNALLARHHKPRWLSATVPSPTGRSRQEAREHLTLAVT
jgi:hypothetical protein